MEEYMADLTGKRVAILATDMFEEAELLEPRQALDDAGAQTEVIAPHDGELQAARHFDKGKTVKVDKTIDQVNPDDYDAVLLPGGALNADNLRVEEAAQRFVQELDSAGKPIAVICHGPWLLASAGLTEGRHLTSFHTIKDDLENAGAEWSDETVVRDANWVSSRQPDDIPQFNQAMLELFAEEATA
jgi:protease I